VILTRLLVSMYGLPIIMPCYKTYKRHLHLHVSTMIHRGDLDACSIDSLQFFHWTVQGVVLRPPVMFHPIAGEDKHQVPITAHFNEDCSGHRSSWVPMFKLMIYHYPGTSMFRPDSIYLIQFTKTPLLCRTGSMDAYRPASALMVHRHQ
jgi:hypothetical protein